MAQVVDAAEQLMLQLRVVYERDGAVLVQGSRVALEARAEVGQVGGDLFNHHSPEW